MATSTTGIFTTNISINFVVTSATPKYPPHLFHANLIHSQFPNSSRTTTITHLVNNLLHLLAYNFKPWMCVKMCYYVAYLVCLIQVKYHKFQVSHSGIPQLQPMWGLSHYIINTSWPQISAHIISSIYGSHGLVFNLSGLSAALLHLCSIAAENPERLNPNLIKTIPYSAIWTLYSSRKMTCFV